MSLYGGLNCWQDQVSHDIGSFSLMSPCAFLSKGKRALASRRLRDTNTLTVTVLNTRAPPKRVQLTGI